MSSIQKHKLKNKVSLLGDEEIELFGASAEDAAMWSNLVAELAKGGGAVAASELKKKEDAKAAEQAKKDAEKKAAAEAEKNREGNEARAAAAAARKRASIAAAEALAEKDPKGPLHNVAEQLETAARVAEAKAAIYASPGGLDLSKSSGPSPIPPSSSGIPWWGWALGAGFVTIGGALTYRLVRKK